MITIEERETIKMPGLTSLFINFPYNANIVNIISTIPCKYYNKDTKTWEIPVLFLSTLLDKLTLIDDIQLDLLKDIHLELRQYTLSETKTPLFKHQIEAVQYGLNKKCWLLLDLPGCGKSLSALTFAQEIKNRYQAKHCLIICGINNLKYNWIKEIQQHTDLTATILGQYYSKKGKLMMGSVNDRLNHLKSNIDEFCVITNIETLRDERIIKELIKQREDFPIIIYDEVHKAKSPTSLSGANLLKLKDPIYKLGMTGTLLLNSPLDTYLPLKWIGIEKSSYTTFKSLYCEFAGPFHNILVGFKNLEYLKYQIQQCSLRRSNYEDLPPLTIIPEYVEMENEQRQFYENIVNGLVEEVDKVTLNAANTLALTTRLRQATAYPSILTTEDIPSAKLSRTVELVEQLIENNEKVVIFSTFKDTVYKLKELLYKYNPVVSTGDDNDNIVQVVDDFQVDPNKHIFIATWQKAGTGLTITAASYMIFIDTPWTWGSFEQAYKRIHRTGTTRPVFIYELITKDTFDESVHEILYDKQAMSEYLIDDNLSTGVLDRIKRKLLTLN